MSQENGRLAGTTNANTEVTPPSNRKKRYLTAEYKARVLEEIEGLPYGQVGA